MDADVLLDQAARACVEVSGEDEPYTLACRATSQEAAAPPLDALRDGDDPRYLPLILARYAMGRDHADAWRLGASGDPAVWEIFADAPDAVGAPVWAADPDPEGPGSRRFAQADPLSVADPELVESARLPPARAQWDAGVGEAAAGLLSSGSARDRARVERASRDPWDPRAAAARHALASAHEPAPPYVPPPLRPFPTLDELAAGIPSAFVVAQPYARARLLERESTAGTTERAELRRALVEGHWWPLQPPDRVLDWAAHRRDAAAFALLADAGRTEDVLEALEREPHAARGVARSTILDLDLVVAAAAAQPLEARALVGHALAHGRSTRPAVDEAIRDGRLDVRPYVVGSGPDDDAVGPQDTASAPATPPRPRVLRGAPWDVAVRPTIAWRAEADPAAGLPAVEADVPKPVLGGLSQEVDQRITSPSGRTEAVVWQSGVVALLEVEHDDPPFVVVADLAGLPDDPWVMLEVPPSFDVACGNGPRHLVPPALTDDRLLVAGTGPDGRRVIRWWDTRERRLLGTWLTTADVGALVVDRRGRPVALVGRQLVRLSPRPRFLADRVEALVVAPDGSARARLPGGTTPIDLVTGRVGVPTDEVLR